MNRLWQLPLIAAVSFVLLGGGTGTWCALALGMDHEVHAHETCHSEESDHEHPCTETCSIDLDEMILSAALTVPSVTDEALAASPPRWEPLQAPRTLNARQPRNAWPPSRGEPERVDTPLVGQLRV